MRPLSKLSNMTLETKLNRKKQSILEGNKYSGEKKTLKKTITFSKDNKYCNQETITYSCGKIK